jgi:hypothetical protein
MRYGDRTTREGEGRGDALCGTCYEGGEGGGLGRKRMDEAAWADIIWKWWKFHMCAPALPALGGQKIKTHPVPP